MPLNASKVSILFFIIFDSDMANRLGYLITGALFLFALAHFYPSAKMFYRITKINQQRVQHTSARAIFELNSDSLRIGSFLCYGQSNAGNFGELNQEPWENVLQVCNGELYAYEVPSCGTGGRGGNHWGNVGKNLIEEGYFDQVVFANASVGGSTLSELSTVTYLDYLLLQHTRLKSLTGRVDAILFMQGESDYGEGEAYRKTFDFFISQLQQRGIETPILISQTSICQSHISDSLLLSVQRALSREIEQVKAGPNTDLINFPGSRYDYCHFSKGGLDSLSTIWSNSIAEVFKLSSL